MRARLARQLRAIADRIDDDHAFRCMTTLSLTLERGAGWTLRRDGRGVPIWYHGHADYDRAHDEAENPV